LRLGEVAVAKKKKTTRSAAKTPAKRAPASRTKRSSKAVKKAKNARTTTKATKTTKGKTKKTKRTVGVATAAAATKKADMVVVVSSDRPAAEVAGELKNAGFEVGEVLHAINQVTGRAAPSLKSRLRGIRGVEDVSEAHPDFNIGPPDAPVQ